MIIRLLNWLSSRLPNRLIPREDKQPYLLRSKIRGWMPGDDPVSWSLYLHRFYSHDVDPAPHSHPWKWSVSLVLTGGYIEERRCADGSIKVRTVKPFRLNFFGPNSYHRISMLCGREVWTLFLAGPKFQSWGFMDPVRGFIPWRDRLRERGIEP